MRRGGARGGGEEAGVVVDLLFSPDSQMGKNRFDVSL